MTSLHPPSFHRNDFSTCSTHFSFGAKPQQKFVARARIYTLRTRMRTRTTPPRPLLTCTRACYGVVQCLPGPMKSPTIYRRNLRAREKTIAWCPYTPPSTVERFGEEISAEACSGKEIAGLLRKMIMMMNMMTRKSINCI